MQNAAHAYLQTQVSTTSQSELLLMLYDAAIKYLKQAQDKIREKDYAGKGILISRALDVVSELDSSLNPQKGGDLATNLHKLYFYCNTRMLQANMNMDTGLIDEVVKILTGLRSAFQQAAQSTSAAPGFPGKAPSAHPSAPAGPAAPTPHAAAPTPIARTMPLPPTASAQPATSQAPPIAGPIAPPTASPAAHPAAPPAAGATAAPAPAAPLGARGKLLAGSNMYRKIAQQG